MGKLKLTNTDMSYINNFLHYDDKKIDKDWVNTSAIVNICLFYSSVVLSDKKILCGVVFTIINALLVFILIYFNRKVEHNKGNLYLYYGIYMCILPISISVPESLILRMLLRKYFYPIIIVQYCLIILVALITMHLYKRRICLNYYKYRHSASPVFVSIISGAVLLGSSLIKVYNIDLYLFLGTNMAILSILFASSTYFFVKSYCYYLTKKK